MWLKVDSNEANFPTFSPVLAKGALNHCSKVWTLLKMWGSRKFRRDHSSGSLFCRGVPAKIQVISFRSISYVLYLKTLAKRDMTRHVTMLRLAGTSNLVCSWRNRNLMLLTCPNGLIVALVKKILILKIFYDLNSASYNWKSFSLFAINIFLKWGICTC